MKKKDAQAMLDAVAVLTYRTDGTMVVRNDQTKDVVDVDFKQALTIARGVMAWCENMLELDLDLSAQEHLKNMLIAIATSIEFDLHRTGNASD